MKKISSIILSSLVMLSGFTSCELKDELWGKETSNTSGQLTKHGKVTDMGINNGNVQLNLEEGTYVAKAYNYDGSNVTVSTRPYFMGTREFQILPGKVTNAPVVCKLQNIEVMISLAQSFIDSFKDDYSITVDNGAGAIQVFTTDNIKTKYY